MNELKPRPDEARQRLDERNHEPLAVHTDITPDAGDALWELLRRMPGVVGNGLSGDDDRVALARKTLARLGARLRDAGIDVDQRFTGFADRLAGLRDEFLDRA
jgi:hypothetical protein